MSDFRDDLASDLTESFLNVSEFGETVTLTRSGVEYSIPGLFDTPELGSDSLGIDVEAIAHTCRLFVRSADLPDEKPLKNDRFALAATQFHSSLNLIALDYVFEKDGTVIYRCKETR